MARGRRVWHVSFAATRALVRLSAWLRVGVAALVGVAAGFGVAAMTRLAETAHVVFYGIAFDERLSAQTRIALPVGLATLCGGALALALIESVRKRHGGTSSIDPVEANALYGGRLPLAESLWVGAQTLISNGVGASVGLEAGYAQVGSALAAQVGLWLRFRRQDLRTLVGCGAAGAMAAAFNAPLTGAFYAFELIIGVYSLANAAPVLAAAVAGSLAVHALGGAPYTIVAQKVPALGIDQHLALIGLGLISALLGVAAMRSAAVVERAFRLAFKPTWLRLLAGGVILAVFATITPQTLGAGHGALALDFARPMPASKLTALFGLKLFASLISLASGFRGGLFFASLFLGALLGKLYAAAVATVAPWFVLNSSASLFAGMATLGAAIVGAPLTMAFLVVESSGDLGIMGPVLAASLAAQLAVRTTFGYSFSTWRLHLRGETITGAQDVGWLRTMLVVNLMDPRPRTMQVDSTLAAFRLAHPLGSSHSVILVDGAKCYAGLVSTAEAHALGVETDSVASLARLASVALRPNQNVREAMEAFDASESDTLAVIDADRHVVGLLGEAYAARRYAAASDRVAQGVLGS